MNIEQSMIVDLEEIVEINTAPLSLALSYNMSLSKKFILIGTEKGFCLVDNSKKSFKRFEGNKNPFVKQPGTGVQLGAALEQRCEVAIIPSKSSSSYSRTTVYIFDYRLETILYSNNFFLPIKQLTLTDNTMVVSNNKRIIIYNYSNDSERKTQEYYLKMYASKEPNNTIRYLEMSCEEKIGNNSILDLDDGADTVQRIGKECICGKYAISSQKPYRIVYSKVYTLNGTKMIQLSIYDWAYDKDYIFESAAFNQPFSFTISFDGSYVAYTQNYGRTVNVHKLPEKVRLYTLSLSSSIKPCISQGFFTHDDTLWYTMIRRGDNSAGHMHFFKLPAIPKSSQKQKEKDREAIKSRYSRYFSLYEKTMADYGICDRLIGPDFYENKGAVFVPSICGVVTEIIDFNVSGHHAKKNVENMVKWVEDLS